MIETERLWLRPLRAADEDDLFAYQSDPDVVRYIPWPVRTREEVRAALARAAAMTAPKDEGDSLVLGIEEKTRGVVIGQLNLMLTKREDRGADIGYVVHPAFAGRGIATEATSGLLDYAFTQLDRHRVTALIDTRNLASAAVAAKLGMRREAEFIESEWFKGEWTSVWIYAILHAEWSARRG